MKKGDEPVVISQHFDVTPERLWTAVTNIRELRKWFFSELEVFQPEPGFETEFLVKNGEREFLHQWLVTEVKPPEKLVCLWQYAQYPGQAHVVFEIESTEDGARLTVSSHVIESFPDHVPEFETESCRAGWNFFIKQSLKGFLASR